MTRAQAIERARKLAALAGSGEGPEQDVARTLLEKHMAAHELVQGDLDPPKPRPGPDRGPWMKRRPRRVFRG